MKQLRKFSTLIFIALCFSSCTTMFLSSMGVFDDSPSLKKMNNRQKSIVFIPMHHIGKQTFYDGVRKDIDSLRKMGYVFYFEGIRFSPQNDSLSNDTLAMKVRKLIGVDIRAMKSNGGYIDTLTNTFMGAKIKAIDKHKLVNQPKYYQLFDTTTDRRVDVYLSDALSAFEEKYGAIPLNDCDFNTPPAEIYKCKKYKANKARKFLAIDYRNDFVVKEILKDTHTKIAIVYGARHAEGILKGLQQNDSAWKSY